MNPQSPLMNELRGIHLPPDPSLWPPAPGWWIVALLAGVILWRALVVARRVLNRARRRRKALAALASIHARVNADPDATLCADLSVLLRRLAIGRFPREQVAALTGQPWLQFLERSCDGDAAFIRAGQALLEAPYRQAVNVDVDTLVRLSGVWIRKVL